MATNRSGTGLELQSNTVVDNRWKVEKFLRMGTFGSAFYEVLDTARPIRTCTLQIELRGNARPGESPKFLLLVKKLLSAVNEHSAVYNLRLEGYGEWSQYNFVVVNCVGFSLEELRIAQPDQRFSLRTCLHIARRSLLCIEELHNAGFIHRDVKPVNLFIGKPPDDLRQMYLGNYELCRQYVDDDGKVLPHREVVQFRGTPRYASVSALEGHDQCRTDDMWAWFFALVELTTGNLPWDRKGPQDLAAYFRWLAGQKKSTMDDVDSFLQGCPREYKTIVESLKKLQQGAQPPYDQLLQAIRDTEIRKEYTLNIPLDWEPKAVRVERVNPSTRRV